MYQDLITARLKDGITGIKLYAGVENYIELKDLIEVRGTFGTVFEQPQLSGAVINRFIQFTGGDLPTGMSWYGFRYDADGWIPGVSTFYSSSAGSSGYVSTAIRANPTSTGSGTLIIQVNVGQLIGYSDIDSNSSLEYLKTDHTYSRVAYVALPYEVVAAPTNPSEIAAPAPIPVPTTALPTTFLQNNGVDLFFDLQSRALSLTPPKAEATIANDSKVINTMEVERLIVKTGETLWLNLRFVKGTTPFDPVASDLRFGVAGKLGGPLLMEGDSFTKVGEGPAAYYRMRVTAIENEFAAIIDDYYDEDAVEQIASANENQPSTSGDIEGLCELVLTTGSGETIADIKSDTLGVVLKRSIFA